MKRFMIFKFYCYEPSAGMRDFYTDHDGTLGEAIDILSNAIEEEGDTNFYNGHIYDTMVRAIVYSV